MIHFTKNLNFTKGALQLCLLLATTSLFAQTPDFMTQPATTTGTPAANTVPYYYGTNGTKAQALYPASVFSSIPGPRLITAVYMIPTVTGAWTYNNIDISIGQPNITSLTTTAYATGMKQVFSRTNFTINRVQHNWFKFELDSSFYFDPSLPLVVEIKVSNLVATSWTTQTNDPYIAGSYRNYSASYGATVPTSSSASAVNKLGLDLKTISANNAAMGNLVSPIAFCQGNHDIKVKVRNSGANIINNVTIKWELDGQPQTPFYLGSPLDTAGGTTYPVDTILLIGNASFGTTIRNIKAWTEFPNNTADTINVDDTLNVQVRAALSGTYTIGGLTPDYATVSAAVTALNSWGVCGPVIFNVDSASGPYTAGITFGNINGSSAINTITFNGNGATLTGTTNPLVGFNGSKYITINNFNIMGSGAFAGFGMHIGNQSNNITINGNKINVGTTATATTNAGIVVSGLATDATAVGNNAQYVTVTNNEITGGYYSVAMAGAAGYLNNYGHNISNNKLKDFYYSATYFANADTVTISGNDMNRLNRTSVPTTAYGMYHITSRNLKIRNNIIHDLAAATTANIGIGFANCVNSVGYETEVTNNTIYNLTAGGTGYAYGISGLTTSTTGFIMYHNTIDLTAPATTANIIRGVNFAVAPSNVFFKNNIINITGGGTGVKTGIYVTTTSTSFSSNHNVIHVGTTANNNVGYWTAARATLADWQTASLVDTNSVSNNPVFANASTGNLTPLSINCDNIGTALGVANDILGNPRSVATPDAGAYEFTGISGDIAITTGSLYRASNCYSNVDTVKITIQNLIGSTVDFGLNPLTINWNVLGPVSSSGTITIFTDTLQVGGVKTVFAKTVDRSQHGTYTLTAHIQPNTVNTSTTNDTLAAVNSNVASLLTVAQRNFTVNATTDSVTLQALSPLFPGGNVFFTEVAHYKVATGAPTGGWPAYMIADDYVEITGVPNSDLAGYVMEEWTGTTLQHTVTFPSGTLFSPSGTMVIATGQLTSSIPVPASFYYHSGNTVNHSSTGDLRGYVIKAPGGTTVVDAVTYGAYTFPIASGVTAVDWSGSTPVISSSGNKLNGPDNNTASNWVNSGTVAQNPNTLNANVPVGSPTSLTGFTWSLNNSPIDTLPRIKVGGYTVPGVYTYVATYTNSCGTFYDTVFVTAGPAVPVKLTNFTATPSNNDVNLTWQTASERNASRFEVYASTDGRNFEVIGAVKAKGNSSSLSSYRLTHNQAMRQQAQAIYYKLKMIDVDGTFTWSNQAIVKLNRNTKVSLYPNPFTGVITLQLPETGTTQVSVANLQGKTLYSNTIEASTNTTTLTDLQHLQAGVYFVSVTQNGNTTIHKVVKQ